MTHVTRQSTIALGALLALLLAPAPAAAGPCSQVFERLYPENNSETVRYVKGERGNDITYGLEGEVNLQKAPKLLDWYRPSSKTDAQWFAMSYEERLAAIPYRGSGMVKTGRAPEWLKQKLSSDPGGAEFISLPVASLEKAMGMVREVENLLGQDQHGRSRVYWQANVAYKRDGAFSRQQRDGIMGYVKATGDYAQFGKLHKGFEVHQRNSSYIPGKNLGHSVLGPVNKQKIAEMEQELTAASENRSTNRSSHYLQGTYFRTWAYGPDRNGFEARDPHKDVGVLKRELRRLTHGLQHGFGSYARFKNLTVLDESGHFNQLSQPVKQLLNRLGYSKRYALPMRPFEQEYPRALGLSGQQAEQLRSRITAARNGYVSTLESLAAQHGTGGDKTMITNKVRVALAKFVHDSGMYTALDNHFAGIGQASLGGR